MELKKICFAVSAPLTVNAFLRHHITELAKHYKISVIANIEDKELNDFQDLPLEEIIHVKIVRNISPKYDLLAIKKLIAIFNDRKFDAVHSVTPKAGLLVMTAARMAGIKNRIHIFTGQVWFTKKGFFRKLLMEIDRLIVKSATHILVDGKSQRSFLIDSKILKAENSRVLGQGSISGVNEKRFTPSLRIREQQRSVLNFSSEEVVFAFLGRLNADKGIRELALAFNILSQEFCNAKLLLVGYDEENVMNFVEEAVMNRNAVVFYGSTDRPEEILQAADVFCLPSHREGFGTSVLEASLLGLPVICSDTYGLKETIIDHVTGLRHRMNDVESLHSAMRTLYLDGEKRKSMGKEGRQYVLHNFRAEQITKEWMMFYEEMFR